ncbi:MAG: DnaD domain protein [Clostridia bacterium]|jgi:DnaD/phage-associated family protein|nr:primosome DnaD subunit [Clostridium sp. CAG:571]HJJ06593.1 DnaD domain protein [Clostridiaceae bacterium]HJJ13908.1 DnaD domain protein [Clostridiaceae bacterium]
MKLEQNDSPLLFSYTELPDIFFTEYISQTPGDFIKVYLYLLFLSKYGKDIKVNDLSKKLELPLKVIQDAIKFLEEENLLTKKNTGFIINNIQEIELHKLYNPKVTSSPEQLQKTAENQYRAKAIENINNEFFQGIMSPSWYSDIDLWFRKYNFDEEVMIALFRYCFNRSALHRNYIQAVAEAWAKNNIRTFNDLDIYYEKQEKLKKISKTISKKLGITRQLSQYEEAYIEKWTIEYNYSMDIIEIALKKTTSKANPNFDYLDKLLTDWHDRKFSTIDQIQKFLNDIKQKNKNIKNLEKKSGYQNYDQRNYDNLNTLYANNI